VTGGAVLLDTNVVSELIKPKPDARVVTFIEAQLDPYLSVITLHELTWGAERVSAPARRARLIAWISAMKSRFGGRLIEVDAEIAEHSGRLRAAAAGTGRVVDAVDTIIAASALARGARVATRNVRDFAPLGVEVVDPWSAP
jgi:predicted nucleic acid-binding protein